MLHRPNRVYYPSTLHIAPSSALPALDANFASSTPKSMVTLTSEPSTEKEKQVPVPVVELKSKEVKEVEQLKKKSKEKEKKVAK